MNKHKGIIRQNRTSGFAVVAAISLMALVTLLLLAITAYMQVESLNATQLKDIQKARSNARLALMVAIGELQKQAGPDQRITAEADIINTDGFLGADRHPRRKHYLGIYSTEGWHARDANGIRNSWKPYDPERNKEAFQRWLVSGPPTQINSLSLATTAPDPSEVVLVVGEGTVGNTSSEDLVYVPYQEINADSGSATDRMAYWVGDEGIKARINLTDERQDLSRPEWTNRLARVNPSQMGIDSVEGFENIFDGLADTEKEDALKKLSSYKELGLFNDQALPEPAYKSRFHDLTTYSRGVLADVSLGGLKRDLSLPFELPDLSPPQGATDWVYDLNTDESPASRDASYTTMLEFNNSGDRRSRWDNQFRPLDYRPDWWAKKVGYVYRFPGTGGTDYTGKQRYLRGSSWDALRNHYRLYKRELERLPPSNSARQRVQDPSDSRTWLARPYQPPSHNTGSRNQTPLTLTYVGEFGPGTAAPIRESPSLLDPFYAYAILAGNPSEGFWNNRNHATLGLTPILTRMTLVLGVYGLDDPARPYDGIDTLHFTMDAVGTLWNPYNVAIEFESIFSDIKLEGLDMVMTIPGAPVANLSAFHNGIRIGVTEETDPLYPFQSTAPSKLIRLEPGELRTYSLNYPEPKNYFASAQEKVPGAFVTNAWTGGLYGMWPRQVPEDTQVTFTCTPQARKLWLQNYIGYFYTADGIFQNPFGTSSFYELPQISGVVVNDATDIGGPITKSLSIQEGPQNKTSLMQIDFKLRTSEEMDSTLDGIAREFDPRAIVNHYKAAGNSSKGSIPSNWDININLIGDYDEIQVGISNEGYWGNSSDGSGSNRVVYFEVPDAPIASIAGLQHCQTGPAVWDQPYAIGNSFAPRKLDRDEIFKAVSEPVSSGNSFENVYFDNAYLLNDALWDRYFFTGLTFDQQVTPSNSLEEAEAIMTQFLDPEQENPLGNRRLRLAEASGTTPPIEELTHYRWIARHLMLNGAFNINSTRKEAWKAFLSSLKDVELDKVNTDSGTVSTLTESESLASRSVVVAGNRGEAWTGYASLSDSEIDTLAENIVREVKKRGPFLSIADFINRRISNDETGNEGALQAALRASSLDIGSGVTEGIPGKIRQGDLLSGLGSSISARSDTFVIRAYGASLKSDGQKVLAESWCEAVVQRMPTLTNDNGELMMKANEAFPGNDPSRTELYIENPDIPETAKQMGREFRIISFRWLSSDEV